MAPRRGNRTLTHQTCGDNHEKEGQGRRQRTGGGESRDKKPGLSGRDGDAVLRLICIWSVFVSPFPRLDCVMYSHCEWIDAVRVNPAGETQL